MNVWIVEDDDRGICFVAASLRSALVHLKAGDGSPLTEPGATMDRWDEPIHQSQAGDCWAVRAWHGGTSYWWSITRYDVRERDYATDPLTSADWVYD